MPLRPDEVEEVRNIVREEMITAAKKKPAMEANPEKAEVKPESHKLGDKKRY